MMNYMKSEFYRVMHNKGIYAITGVLAALSLALNLVLWWFARKGPFRYATTSFSFSNLVANPMIFCTMGAIVGVYLYESNRRNGNLKNAIGFGISRAGIFAGQCVVSIVTAIAAMTAILPVYIVSARILLEENGPVTLMDLLTEVPAVLFIAAACMISAIICIEYFDKLTIGAVIWAVIWFVVPKIFFYLGLRYDAVYEVAMWMPENFFGTSGMLVNMSQCITAWATPGNMLRCVLAGVIGMILFFAAGIVLLRKKEL